MMEDMLTSGFDAGSANMDAQWAQLLAQHLHADNDFTSINGPAAAAQTVSPQDVFGQDAFQSVPPSSTFTNLTSPSLTSPDMDSYDCSPALLTNDFDGDNSWFSLFPDSKAEPESAAPALVKTDSQSSFGSPAPLLVHPGGPPRKSSTTSPTHKHSLSAGIVKRGKVLPPIVVDDPTDSIAVKRARNTAAARKSRAKKYEAMEDLREAVAQLEKQLAEKTAEAERWKSLYESQPSS